MKFGKEFKSQMVPEWEEAYMNYDYLKTLLKDIHDFNHKHKPHPTAPTLKRTMTLYRTFSGLTRRYSNSTSPTTKVSGEAGHGDIEDQVILVTAVDHEHNHHPHQLDKNLDHRYETKFLMSSEKGAEYELVYFRRLDDEINKVNKFYKSKVEEVMKEADLLNKQMDALIAFRIKIENPDGTNHHFVNWSVEMTKLASDVAAAVSQTSPRVTSPQTNSLLSPTGTSRSNSRSSNVSREAMPHMDAIKEIEQSLEEQSEESGDDVVLNGTRVISSTSTTVSETKAKKMDVSRPASLDVLDRVTISNTLETPRSTIKGILNVNKNNDIVFGRENLQKVELQLQRAFIEFYQKLRLLKSYSFLNILAFSKIMKKYDKITSRNASKSYLHMVDNSYIGSYDGVTRLMERVEATFIKHFTNANHSKGISILRPAAKRERHRTTFSLGFFAGCGLALLASLILIVRARNILGMDGSTIYMETLFPLYSLFGFIVLHMLMYAINVYAWRRYRVNYPFIFGFKQGTELGYREVFLISSALATLALASVLANLDMEMNKHTKDYKTLTELVPLILVIFVFLVTVCPFNIVYRSSRYFLLVCFFHCICAPFYKVLLPDFFLADQLTSQVQAIRSIEYYICYYGGGGFKSRDSSCKKTGVFKVFNFIIASIPYSFRLFQCLRRLFEEKDRMQGYNALKYFSTIVAVAIRAAYKLNDTTAWLVLALLSSIISAVVSTCWDIVIDWGLFQSNSRNRFLRDKLLVPQQNVYFGAIVLNILLRFAWLQSIFDFKLPFLHMEAMVTIFACLEIIRRGMWNFFRLENEHLNNVGKYRAFKSVPLPFNYDEDDDDKDE
ncbi:hypothetical protein C5167_049227 [Papaver somniferum]|uniref:SPX domain-containing protein n=2 Tax=Papaver somniferum TaxID=3469 RepID=A0A4Y7KMY7_PAPSO|nr:phosphate transporter PHO1 homolog 3-like isoform X1 [Papaver somniferum]XP_026405919.1 phosphate transporter PHO1 homolog 3-like isoform X1 [Papaver somniferum]XP_026405920.1 phosphate transporter PHO1 homolog 3-like isoform X1 [Papaver somniferum]XP_026405921.1 phosphate transporter PHO1 homolog 3-like isoform X1 [Papaver somniferum]XP_026405922.1 phosphate transporter PHO1 homolog 3-like isoform X1 [Papaver somniferum]XP_026405923.1 phosphate transporter PHO1 homolog 3-like isoform X1 [P